MKNIFIYLLFFVALYSCKKNHSPACENVLPSSEETQIVAFCNTHSISYTKDSTGIFYQIIDIGSGASPTLSSKISYIYTASSLDGTILDEQASPVSNKLSELIEGFRIAIPWLKKGGHIKMVVPSAFCYGCLGNPGVVPPNTILFFDLTLVDVQ